MSTRPALRPRPAFAGRRHRCGQRPEAVRRTRAVADAGSGERGRGGRRRGAPRRRAGQLQGHGRREAGGVSEDIAPEIVLALEIDDPALADRLAALLGNIAGLRLAEPGEKAAAAIVTRDPRIMPDDIALTQRELDVLALMAEGGSNKMIARQLGISVHTVKFHVGSLLDKLDATGRTDAVAHAARRGVIEL